VCPHPDVRGGRRSRTVEREPIWPDVTLAVVRPLALEWVAPVPGASGVSAARWRITAWARGRSPAASPESSPSRTASSLLTTVGGRISGRATVTTRGRGTCGRPRQEGLRATFHRLLLPVRCRWSRAPKLFEGQLGWPPDPDSGDVRPSLTAAGPHRYWDAADDRSGPWPRRQVDCSDRCRSAAPVSRICAAWRPLCDPTKKDH
jgi:hypothetical protein